MESPVDDRVDFLLRQPRLPAWSRSISAYAIEAMTDEAISPESHSLWTGTQFVRDILVPETIQSFEDYPRAEDKALRR